MGQKTPSVPLTTSSSVQPIMTSTNLRNRRVFRIDQLMRDNESRLVAAIFSLNELWSMAWHGFSLFSCFFVPVLLSSSISNHTPFPASPSESPVFASPAPVPRVRMSSRSSCSTAARVATSSAATVYALLFWLTSRNKLFIDCVFVWKWSKHEVFSRTIFFFK